MVNEAAASEVLKVTDQNQSDMVSQHSLLVIDCYADWCGPCRMIAPVIQEMAGEYSGRVSFGKVDVDSNQGVARQYNVSSIPTLLFFKDGQLADRLVGALPKPALKEKVEAMLES